MDDRRHSARMQFLRNLPRHGLTGLLAAGVWLTLVLNAAAAGGALDQSQTAQNNFQQLNGMAQTFTAGASGQLDKVSLATATQLGSVSGTVTIQTVGPGGAPSGTVLASTPYTGFRACCNQWYDFTFTAGVNVAAGTKYAIVLTTSGPRPTWWDNFGFDSYLGGELWLKSGSTWLTSTPTNNFGKDFAFKTFVVGATNQPPTIIASRAAVVANEGSPATNSGTYSDPDGDAVSFTASKGTVAKTGTSSGNWTWSLPAADEGTTAYVTVTANDGHGNQPFTTFAVTFVGVPPTAIIQGAPASVSEGTPVSLTGTATSPSAEDTAAGFSLAWTLTKNGNPFGTGTGAGGSFSFTPDDDGTYVVTLSATDDGGLVGTKSATIIGTNAAPTATITGVYSPTAPVITTQEPIEFQGSIADAGVLDTHVVTWTFGDGSSSTQTFAASGSEKFEAYHSYAAAGTYQVGLSVLDDDGGSGAASYTITVQTPGQAIDAIGGYVQGHAGLSNGEKNSLLAKLRAASNAADRGSFEAACNQLDAFLNEVDAKTKTGQLSSSDQTTLSGATRAAQRSLGCFSKLLAFLATF